MTATNTLVEDTLAYREANQKIAQILGGICAIVLVVASIAFAAKLLYWAIDQKGVDPDATSSTEITLEMRERQLGCLAKNIYYEAGNQPFEGKVAVAQVTINRVNSGQYPDDICKTIYQKNIVYEKVLCQFSWVCDRITTAKPINRVSYKESEEVAKKVLLEGFRLPSLEKAMYFHGDYINPGWKRERIAKIGNHIFYK